MPTDGWAARWNGVEYDAAAERALDSIGLMAAGTPFSARPGVRPGAGGLAVSVSGSQLTVTPGGGVIYDSRAPGAGAWRFAVLEQKTKSLSPRPGPGFSRIDLVVARVVNVEGSDPVRDLLIEVVEGDAKATPSAPELPSLSVELARLTVPATGNIVVASSLERTVAPGGVLPVASTDQRNRIVGAWDGLVVYNEQTNAHEALVGGRWLTVMYRREGTFSVSTDHWTVRRPLRWIIHHDIVTLYGCIRYADGPFPATGFVRLNGVPAPSQEVGVLIQNGNSGAYSANLRTNQELWMNGKLSTHQSELVSLDGLSYPTNQL